MVRSLELKPVTMETRTSCLIKEIFCAKHVNLLFFSALLVMDVHLPVPSKRVMSVPLSILLSLLASALVCFRFYDYFATKYTFAIFFPSCALFLLIMFSYLRRFEDQRKGSLRWRKQRYVGRVIKNSLILFSICKHWLYFFSFWRWLFRHLSSWSWMGMFHQLPWKVL